MEHTEVDRDLDADEDNKISTAPTARLALSPRIITWITTAGRDIHLDPHLVVDVAGDNGGLRPILGQGDALMEIGRSTRRWKRRCPNGNRAKHP